MKATETLKARNKRYHRQYYLKHKALIYQAKRPYAISSYGRIMFYERNKAQEQDKL